MGEVPTFGRQILSKPLLKWCPRGPCPIFSIPVSRPRVDVGVLPPFCVVCGVSELQEPSSRVETRRMFPARQMVLLNKELCTTLGCSEANPSPCETDPVG